MTSLSELTMGCCLATGIAETDRVGASAKAQAANPISKSRFMFPPWIAVIAVRRKVQTAIKVPFLKLGHCEIQIRPLRIETGHYRLRWFRTFAMSVSQIYDADDDDTVEMKIELESKGAAN
jgi:hypothetical protein